MIPFWDTIPAARTNCLGKEESKPMSKTNNLAAPALSPQFKAPQLEAAADVRSPGELLLLPGEAIDSLHQVHATIRTKLPRGQVNVYEAGGGSTSFLPSDVLSRSNVTVVDVDPSQLQGNAYAQTRILGDIQTYRFAPATFDLVTCYNVIEHLSDVGAALTGIFQSLKPGGLAVIAAPNPSSLSGVVTKFTPHWFHVWYYRHVMGSMSAGLPGEPPFPTIFHPLVKPTRLVSFAQKHGVEVVYRKEYESPRYPEMRALTPALARLIDGFATVLNFMLPSGADIRHGDYHLVLRKT